LSGAHLAITMASSACKRGRCRELGEPGWRRILGHRESDAPSLVQPRAFSFELPARWTSQRHGPILL